MIFFFADIPTKLSLKEKVSVCLSIVAVCYLDSHGCRSDHRDVCCLLCCHGDGCHPCLSAADDDSGPGCGRIAGDGRDSVLLRSADSCCSRGKADADRGCCCAALSHLCQSFHLQTTACAEAWGSCHSTAAASAAATSCCSSTRRKRTGSFFYGYLIMQCAQRVIHCF